jgi:hypothetical protein
LRSPTRCRTQATRTCASCWPGAIPAVPPNAPRRQSPAHPAHEFPAEMGLDR